MTVPLWLICGKQTGLLYCLVVNYSDEVFRFRNAAYTRPGRRSRN
jgi:hypothetical protein